MAYFFSLANFAAAWGSGAVAPSAAAGAGRGSDRESDPVPDAEGRAAELCGETAFEELGLGASAGNGNLEDALVK